MSSNGGNCYKACGNPVVLNATMGYLGSHAGSGVDDWHAYCVWIISPYIPPRSQHNPTINISIDDLNTDCGWVILEIFQLILIFLIFISDYMYLLRFLCTISCLFLS